MTSVAFQCTDVGSHVQMDVSEVRGVLYGKL